MVSRVAVRNGGWKEAEFLWGRWGGEQNLTLDPPRAHPLCFPPPLPWSCLICSISTLILSLFCFLQGAPFQKPTAPGVFPGHWGGPRPRPTMPSLLLLAAALLSSWAQLPAEASSWW